MSADEKKEQAGEEFLSRWSRLKEEARRAPPEQAAQKTPDQVPEKVADPKGPAPELPPLDKLTFDSDYRAFFHPKVGEDTRRAALKKLFGDPRFNVMDGLDVYIDDYSKTEPIPPEMLAGLKQAQKILQWAKEDEEERKREERARGGDASQEAPANQELEPPQSPPEVGVEEGAPEPVPTAREGVDRQSG